MKLGFEESRSSYTSGSQSARAWTESWVRSWAYCPNCGNPQLSSFPNNTPVADFFCPSCSEEFKLKSKKGKFGPKLANGSFKTKCERLASSNNPNFFLMNYDFKTLAIVNLFIVPKHFFVREIIEERQAASSDGAPCRLDRLEHPTRPGPRVRQDSHCAERHDSS